MTLKSLTTMVNTPRFFTGLALASVVALSSSGCSRNRQSYRPIYGTPVTTAPCTNCGSSSSSPITSGSSITTDSSEPTTSSSVPSLSGPTSSAVPSSPPAPVSAGAGPSPEAPPKARVGGVEEPGYNDLAPIGGGTSSSSSARPAVKSKPSSGTTTNNQMPEMLGPNAGIAAPRRAGRSSATLLGAAPSTPVVRTSLNEQIRPYLDAAGTNDLLYPDRADRPWRYIILHHSAATSGNYSQIDKEHRQVLGIEGCGYHFVIGNGNGSEDGKIEVAQRWVNQKQGVHCRNAKSHDMDEYGVGVCLIGDIDQDPPTPKQIAATQALVAYLSDRYRIKRDNVSTHTHIATTPTVCPGKYFPQESSFTGKKSASTTTPARATSAMLYRHGY